MTNILYCGNAGVFDGVLTSALSVLKRTESREPFTFYVFTMSLPHLRSDFVAISESQIRFLDGVVKEYNGENRVLRCDVTDIYMSEFDGCPNEGAQLLFTCFPFSRCIYARRHKGAAVLREDH